MQNNTVAEPSLYRVQSCRSDFIVGTLPGGMQALISFFWPDVLVAVFDGVGNYLRLDSYPFSEMLSDGQDIRTTDYLEGWTAIEQWAASIGFTEETISVKKFTAIQDELEIRDFASDIQYLLETDEELSEDDLFSIEHWRSKQYFLLICGRHLEMAPEGKCIGS